MPTVKCDYGGCRWPGPGFEVFWTVSKTATKSAWGDSYSLLHLAVKRESKGQRWVVEARLAESESRKNGELSFLCFSLPPQEVINTIDYPFFRLCLQ